jgi:hypothetical protein
LVRTFSLSHLLMINNNSENYPPEIEIIGGVIEVTPDVRGLIGGLGNTTSYQVQEGDFLMDRSRGLLQRHFRRIELLDQDIIRQTYEAWVRFRHITQSVNNI